MTMTIIISFFAGLMGLILISKWFDKKKEWTAHFDSEEGEHHTWSAETQEDLQAQYDQWTRDYVGFKYNCSVDHDQWVEEITDLINQTEECK
jgi:hypothetical protein